MLKNHKWKYIILILLLSVVMVLPSSFKKANASTIDSVTIQTEEPVDDPSGDLEGEGEGSGETAPEEIPFEGYVISEEEILDRKLYSALLSIYKKSPGATYTGSDIYTDMFKNIKEINLDGLGISSLSGFGALELDSLESFSANRNNLTEFDTTFLQNINPEKFTSLSLAVNKLSSVNLSSFPYLSYLDISSNNISNLDMSNVSGKVQNSTVTINIANNRFKSASNIVLPEKRISRINLNIINNNLTDIPENYFSSAFDLKVGVQGFMQNETISINTASNLIVYPFNQSGLGIQIYKTDGDVVARELVATITDQNIVTDYDIDSLDNAIRVNLPVGEYTYDYIINGEKAFVYNDHTRYYLDSGEFKVIPQKATYNFVHKGKEYKELGKVTGKVTVNLSSNETDAKIFYQVNGSEWVEGTTVECDKGGSYSINVKVVINGVDSEIQTIWVRTSLNLYVSDWLMLVLVLLLALVLFLVVVPIISKKYFKKD